MGGRLLGLTPDILRKLYVDDGLSETEIADRYGTYQVKIGRLRRKWGIPTMTKGQRVGKALPDLTHEQDQLIIGSLLGDGSVDATSDVSARFCEGHSVKQGDYVKWKASILDPFSLAMRPGTKTDKKTGNVFHSLSFYTHSCPQFRPYYDLFYPQGVRVFPADLHTRMTPLVLAIWFMDDGCLLRGQPRIAFGLDELSLRRALKALRVLGLKPKVYGGVDIQFPKQGYRFRQLVQGHIPECMSYKIPTETSRQTGDRKARALTPDKAQDLYEGGASVIQIAEMFGVGRSTVSRRLTKAGVQKRKPGPSKGKLSLKAASVLLKGKTVKNWCDLSDETKKQKIDEVFHILRRCPFPIGGPFTGPKAQIDKDKVASASLRLGKNNRILPIRRVGIALCSSYFPNRYKAVSRKRKSAFEVWHTDKALRRAIRFQFRVGDPVMPHRVLRAVTMNCRTPTVFRPTIARFIYQRYLPNGGRTWDCCAGYGGRLLGAVVSGVEYIGTDVEPETVQGNLDLAAALGEKVQVHCCPAEEFDPPPVDLVFTSPPYFQQEMYAGGPQSWKRYPSFDEWVEFFLLPVIQRGAKALRPGGHFVLNVADVRRGKQYLPLVGKSVELLLSCGLSEVETLRLPLSKINREDPWEPILVFQKRTTQTPIRPRLTRQYCPSCGKPIATGDICCEKYGQEQKHTKVCDECGKSYPAKRESSKFCSEACGARSRRRRYRESNPPKTTRTFTCQECKRQWQTEAKGNFRYCPECREGRQREHRTKTCAYRHCGVSFVDTSPKNSMRFCCPDHRRREKMFRSGKAQDLSYFRDERPQGQRTCQDCRQSFVQREGEQNIRCPSCREKRRQKQCRKCGTKFRDGSQNNTRRYCDSCVSC